MRGCICICAGSLMIYDGVCGGFVAFVCSHEEDTKVAARSRAYYID